MHTAKTDQIGWMSFCWFCRAAAQLLDSQFRIIIISWLVQVARLEMADPDASCLSPMSIFFSCLKEIATLLF